MLSFFVLFTLFTLSTLTCCNAKQTTHNSILTRIIVKNHDLNINISQQQSQLLGDRQLIKKSLKIILF